MRVIVFGPGTPDITVEHDAPLTRRDLLDDDGLAERRQALQPFARPAADMFAGRNHLRFMAAVNTLRRSLGEGAIDVAFVSAVLGVVHEHAPIVPCRGMFGELPKAELPMWGARLGLRQQVQEALDGRDVAIYLLEGEALRALRLPLSGPRDMVHVFIVSRDDARVVPKGANIRVITGGQDESTAHGVKVTDLRIHFFEVVCEALAENGTTALAALRCSDEALQGWMQPRLPMPAPLDAFHKPFEVGAQSRVRFFIPECDDRVDPGFDFLNDEPSLHRKSDLDDAFAHDPELYGRPNYDGLLVSKNQVEERQFKRLLVERVGIHRYLRVPADYPVMGDCGAFTYVSEAKPPYETEEILQYYARTGFDYGVSIDHLIIAPVYMRPSWGIVRLDGSRLDLTEEQHKRLRATRSGEPQIAAMEETLTYFPEEDLVVVERKLLKGAEGHPGTWPHAFEQLVACGNTPPFNTSRLARMRQFTYFKAHLNYSGEGTKGLFAAMTELVDDQAIAQGRFTPMDRSEYDELFKRRARRELVGETLRQDKLIYYPESEDAALERVQVNLREIRYRFLLTLRNGRRFLRRHHLGGYGFTPIGAVQGWHGPLFRYAVNRFLRMGYRYLAIGGLAMARNEEILEVLRAVQPELEAVPGVDLHLFGVARNEHVDTFIRLGVTSFDSTGPLRKAWLNATANYLTVNGPAYAAIRIPDPHSSPKAKAAINVEAGVTRQHLLALERKALDTLRAYDRDEADIEETLDAIMAYDELLGDDRKFRELFRRTLEDRPWKHCPCDVCQKVGVDVMIFRGNDRNRRRGFHNTWVFYQELKQIRANMDNHNPDPREIRAAVPAPKEPFVQLALEF
jgi:hypothetical protein